MATDTGGR